MKTFKGLTDEQLYDIAIDSRTPQNVLEELSKHTFYAVREAVAKIIN